MFNRWFKMTTHPNPTSRLSVTNNPPFSVLFRLFDGLTRPASSITDSTQRRQSRLLFVLLLFSFTTSSLGWSYSLATSVGRDPVFFGAWAALIGLTLVFYLVNKSGRYAQAVLLTLSSSVVTNLGIYLYGLAVNNTVNGLLDSGRILSALGTVVLVILASLFFSVRVTLLTAVIIITVEIAGLLAFYPNRGLIIGLLLWHTAISSFILFSMIFRNTVEQDRRRELDNALQQAVKINTELVQANADLARAKAVAQESTRLKSEFLNTMSHELRTPLNAINGFTGIMLGGMGGEFDAEAQHMLERVDANGRRLLALINDVLDIAKIEAGRMEITPECVVLRELVARWSDAIGILAQNKGLAFTTHVAPDLPETLFIDVERLTKAVTNLLANAIKFTEQGGVTLALELRDAQL